MRKRLYWLSDGNGEALKRCCRAVVAVPIGSMIVA